MTTTTQSFALFLLLILTTSVTASNLCNPEDLKALLEIRKTFPASTSSQIWLPNTNCCTQWKGVQCNSNNRVSSIDGSLLNFTNSIPSALGNLPYLESIFITNNPHLTSPIPRSLSNLKHLELLDLDTNSLTGPIPDYLNLLPNLSYINLANNNLSGTIPPSLGLAPSATFFDLSNNDLTGTIPETLGSLFPNGSDTSIYLGKNRLTGQIPKAFAKWDVRRLNFPGNKLSGDPSFLFGKSKQLDTLDLSRNEFSFDFSKVEIPTNLVVLLLDHNQIYGGFPPSIVENFVLIYFDVSYNKLCGKIPSSGFGDPDTFRGVSAFSHNKCLCGFVLPACA